MLGKSLNAANSEAVLGGGGQLPDRKAAGPKPRLRSLLQRVLPAPILDALRAFRKARSEAHSLFAGVYQTWDAAPFHGTGFDDPQWARHAQAAARTAIASSNGFIPSTVTNEDALLPFLVALSDKPLTILDYGGGTGATYVNVRRGSTKAFERYVVVERPEVCSRGRELFDDPLLEFHEDTPPGRFDLVLFSQSLQYLSDYKALLRGLADIQPRWFLFIKVPAGDNPTYVTAQKNLLGKPHPMWIFNASELAADMAALGYALTFKGVVDREYNQDEFEPQYRFGRPANLLFERRQDLHAN